MTKYIFQDGGSTDFFNSYIDGLVSSQNSFVSAEDVDSNIQYESNDDLDLPDEEINDNSRYEILRSEMENKFRELENYYDSMIFDIEDTIMDMDFINSDDGQEFMSGLYSSDSNILDTDNTHYRQEVGIIPSSRAAAINTSSIQRSNRYQPLDDSTFRNRQMMVESSGNPNAVGPQTKYGTAKGLFQFIDSTWKQYRPSSDASPFDPEAATIARDKYMTDLMAMYNGDQLKAAAAYNYGPGNLDKVLARHGNNWREHIPQETKKYLNDIFNG